MNPLHNQKINFNNLKNRKNLLIMWGVKNLLIRFFHNQSGQSLMEIIIGLGIGAVLIGTASFGIAFTLRSTTTNQSLAGASQLTQGVLDNVQSFSNASWQNIYSLGKTSSNQYFLVASGTTFLAVRGNEGVAGDDVTNSLIGKWGFDEDAASTSTLTYDMSGNGTNGTLTNSPTRASSTCKLANCLSFDGSNDYIAGGTATIPGSGTGMSIAAWVYPTARQTVTDRDVIFRQNGYLSITPAGQLSSYFYGLALEGYYNGSAVVPLNSWSHLAVTYDSSSGILKMYMNNILDYSTTTSGSISNGQTSFVIGGEPCCGRYFSGKIDDVRVYNRALSAEEITRLYGSQVFTRHFYINDVCRTDDSLGDISSSTTPCAGGTTNDPLTQKITATVQWTAGAGTDEVSLSRYVTRWGNFSFHQTDWSGGSGQEGPLTNPNDEYFSDSNIIATSTLGSFQIQNLSQQ